MKRISERQDNRGGVVSPTCFTISPPKLWAMKRIGFGMWRPRTAPPKPTISRKKCRQNGDETEEKELASIEETHGGCWK